MRFLSFGIVLGIFLLSITMVKAAKFEDGPVINGYGAHTSVKQDLILDKNTHFKIVFDVSTQGDVDKVNSSFNTLARFLNMHVANGIKLENIDLALVVHGKAGFDLYNNNAYQVKYKKDNPNHALLAQLVKANVKVYLCGQSAAYYDIKNNELQSGVKMALSALTAHAILQNQGYTLNPF